MESKYANGMTGFEEFHAFRIHRKDNKDVIHFIDSRLKPELLVNEGVFLIRINDGLIMYATKHESVERWIVDYDTVINCVESHSYEFEAFKYEYEKYKHLNGN